MKALMTVFLCIFYCASISQAHAAESVQTASNGVEISVNSDEFADRYEYSAPMIRPRSAGEDNSAVMLARVKSSGKWTPVMIQGFIMYTGDWRRYSSAIFRGGEQANFDSMERKVVSCRSRPCTLSETFSINLTLHQIERHTADGELRIQLRGASAQTFMIEVPEEYLQALLELANGG